MIGKLSIPDERELPVSLSTPAVCSPELVWCFRHEGELCPRCDGSGYRFRIYCTECGEPAGRPSQGGKALMGLRNRRGREQIFYCLSCHPKLGRRLDMLERMEG